MIILCAITGLLKLVLLIALTGVLASIAAVSRLMEVTITMIHPLTIFLLRQSGRLVILSVKLTARQTSRAFSKMCTMDCYYGGTIMISMNQPDISFDTSMEPDLIGGITADGIIETPSMVRFGGTEDGEAANEDSSQQTNGSNVTVIENTQ